MSQRARLIYLETSGNQAYIFGTNRLRENVGASEVLRRAGTTLVAEAVNQVCGGGLAVPTDDAAELQHWIANQQVALEDQREHDAVEVVVATSGKALVFVRREETARRFVTAWSLLVTDRLLGLDACAVYTDPFDLADPDGLAGALSEAHRRFEEARVCRTSPLARFLRLPVVAECATSGLPAASVCDEHGSETPRSRVVETKRAHFDAAVRRFGALLKGDSDHDVLLVPQRNIDQVAERWGLDWLGVVHADGNGLGQVFMTFARHVQTIHGRDSTTNRRFVEMYRGFSQALDRLTVGAFRDAVHRTFNADDFRRERDRAWTLPIVPIVVGGDDLTVMCDGRRAIPFARRFLDAFEDRCQQEPRDGPIRRIMAAAQQTDRIGMCAGVAVVKPHFPFFSAYRLAEELLRSAKQVKRAVRDLPCSALDFHIAYDSRETDLDTLRARLRPSSPDRQRYFICGRPLVTTDQRLLARNGEPHRWAHAHRYGAFEAAVNALAARSTGNDNRRALPAAQAHAVRAELHRDPRDAEQLFDVLCRRYRASGFCWPEELPFLYPEPHTAPAQRITLFHDALEALEFAGPASQRGGAQ